MWGTNANWRGKVVKSMHDSSEGGHSEVLGTYQRVKRVFYWPKMKETIMQ
jgi:Integrase zinc binding domain